MSYKEPARMYGPPVPSEITDTEEEVPVVRRRRHNLEPFTDSSRTRRLRFWLNVIFLIGAIAGLACYYLWSHHWATIILITASAFKFVELALRILKI